MYFLFKIFFVLIGVFQCQGMVKTFDSKIVGGIDALPYEIPYQVSIQNSSNGFFWTHICGGTLVRASYVLTAAQCVHEQTSSGKYQLIKPQQLRIVAGSLSVNGTGSFVQIRNAYYITYYSSYKPNENLNWNHDLAIIKVNQPFIMNLNIKLIPFRRVPTKKNEECTISGWGKENENATTGTINLKKTTVLVVDYDYCKRMYTSLFTNNMICASLPGRDSCQGDSGGPLVCGGEIVGIASFDDGCAKPSFPGVYTEVAKYTPWIDANSGTNKIQNIMAISAVMFLLSIFYYH